MDWTEGLAIIIVSVTALYLVKRFFDNRKKKGGGCSKCDLGKKE